MSRALASKYENLMERYQALEEEIFGEDKRKEEMREMDNYKNAFNKFLRGETIRNSLKSGSDGAGGYLVPDEFEKKLIEALEEENIIRRIAKKITSNHDLKMPGVASKGVAWWVEEKGVILESDDTFNQIVIKAHKIATSIRVSDELIEDSGFDIEEYVIKEFARRIGKVEGEAFLTGDGVNKPKGLLTDAIVALSAPALNMDNVIELYHSVGTRYRENSAWLMNDESFRILYKEKNAFGRNVWQPRLTDKEPNYLLGNPVYICDAMPAPAPGSLPIAFGDFSYFWIADRGKRSFKRLNELYAPTGQVGFIASQRVDGRLVLPEAVKTLQLV